MKSNVLKRGDSCPSCHGELKPAYVPSDSELARALDKENPIALPPGADSATKEQRAELGELHRCTTCGYVTRFPTETTDRGAEPADRGAEAKDRGSETKPGGGETNDRAEFEEWKRQRAAAGNHQTG